jgi:hypothetical protein
MTYDGSVSKEKVEELARRIVATADPLQVIVYSPEAYGLPRRLARLCLRLRR